MREVRGAGNKEHDRPRHVGGHKAGAGLEDGLERLRSRHPRQTHAVLGDGGHRALQPLEMRQIVLPKRDEDPVVGARKIESGGIALVVLQARLEFGGRTVFHQVGELGEKRLGPRAACGIGLREGEDFLELVEDEQRNEGAAAGVPEHVVAVVEEFPERLAFGGGAGPRPCAGLRRGAKHGILDLLGGRRRGGRVVQPDVDGAEALGPKPRHEACPQEGGLAVAGLAEEHRQELALNPAAEFGDLRFAAVKEASGLLGEGNEAEPGILGVDGCGGSGGFHARRALKSSCRRRVNSGVGSPPARRAKCIALNFSGAIASASGVPSMQTGRTNTAPSAMLRVRSTA